MMLPTEYRFSLKHLMVFIYLVVLTLLCLLLKWETDKDKPPVFSTSSVSLTEQQDTIKIFGEGLYKKLNAVTVPSLVHEKALLWRLLENISTTEVASEDGLLMVASSTGGKVLTLKVAENTPPALLGSIQFGEGISRIGIVGDKALVCLQRNAGVGVVDVKDPANPSLISMISGTGLIADLLSTDSQVYYADIYRGVGRFDLSGADVKNVLLAQVDSPWRLAMLDGRLAVGTLKNKVHLFDLVAGGDIREVGLLEFPTNVRGVAMTGQTLSVALADGSLHAYRVSEWPTLKKTGDLLLPGSPLFIERLDNSSKVIVSLVSGGLSIVDLENPSAPVFSGHLRLAKTFRGLSAEQGVVYSGGNDGLEAFSIAEIESGVFDSLIDDLLLTRDFLKFKPWNGHIAAYANGPPTIIAESASGQGIESKYLAVDNDDMVSIYELQRDQHFQKVDSPLRINAVRDSAVLNDYLYILHSAGVQIRSFSDLGQFEDVAELRLPGNLRVLEPLDETMLLIGTRDAGVHFVDISNPANPQLVTTLAPEKHLQTINIAYDLLVDANRVYVSCGSGGLYVLDVTNRNAPRIIQRISAIKYAKKMAMVDGLLLIADGPDGLFLVDTDAYDVAIPVGRLQLPIRADDMAVTDNALLVSSHPAGTMKLPLPRRVYGLETPSSQELRVPIEPNDTGQFLYVYDDRGAGEVKIMPMGM